MSNSNGQQEVRQSKDQWALFKMVNAEIESDGKRVKVPVETDVPVCQHKGALIQEVNKAHLGPGVYKMLKMGPTITIEEETIRKVSFG